MLAEHLLRDEDVGEQRAQHAAGHQRVTQRLAIGHGLAERIQHLAGGERPPIGRRQRLRHAQRAPDQRDHAIQHQHDEDAAPLRQQQYRLAERGATTGTAMKIIIASDITLAMRRPA